MQKITTSDKMLLTIGVIGVISLGYLYLKHFTQKNYVVIKNQEHEVLE